MGFLNLILMIAIGFLGIAGWLRARQPNAAGPLAQLEAVGGWIGLAGFVWGLWMLLHFVLNLNALLSAPTAFLIALISALSITALSLILAAPTIHALVGNNGLTRTLSDAAQKLSAFKLSLGVVCLGLAAYGLIASL